VSGITHDELAGIFTGALADVVSTVSGFTLAETAPQGNGLPGPVGLMGLCGGKRGTLFVSVNETGLRLLCSYMTGTPEGAVTEADMDDTLGELVNMTAGGAKLRLNDADYAFTLSTPVVLRGNGLTIVTRHRVSVVAGLLSDGVVTAGLWVVY
jgi:CheY-specific phosphatase CheX